MQDNTQNVPQWFTAFVKQNADEHGRLATEIATSRGELTANIETVRGDLGANIETLRGDLGAKTEALRGDLGTSLGRLREEIAINRTEIARAEVRSTRWMIGTILGGLTIAVAALAYIN